MGSVLTFHLLIEACRHRDGWELLLLVKQNVTQNVSLQRAQFKPDTLTTVI